MKPTRILIFSAGIIFGFLMILSIVMIKRDYLSDWRYWAIMCYGLFLVIITLWAVKDK